MPTGYISEDIGWTKRKVTLILKELIEHNFIQRDQHGWTFIRSYLQCNPLDNANQGKAAYRLYQEVPDSFEYRAELEQALNQYLHRLPSPLIDQSKQEQETEETKQSLSETPDHSPKPHTATEAPNNFKSPSAKPEDHFQEYWQEQTRKEKRAKAQEEWIKQGLSDDPHKALEIIEIWKQQKQHRQQYQDRTKTPLPHNWLSNQQWEDEYLTTEEYQPPQFLPLNE